MVFVVPKWNSTPTTYVSSPAPSELYGSLPYNYRNCGNIKELHFLHKYQYLGSVYDGNLYQIFPPGGSACKCPPQKQSTAALNSCIKRIYIYISQHFSFIKINIILFFPRKKLSSICVFPRDEMLNIHTSTHFARGVTYAYKSLTRHCLKGMSYRLSFSFGMGSEIKPDKRKVGTWYMLPADEKQEHIGHIYHYRVRLEYTWSEYPQHEEYT